MHTLGSLRQEQLRHAEPGAPHLEMVGMDSCSDFFLSSYLFYLLSLRVRISLARGEVECESGSRVSLRLWNPSATADEDSAVGRSVPPMTLYIVIVPATVIYLSCHGVHFIDT